MSNASDDDLFLCWVFCENAKNPVQAQVIRDGIGPKLKVFSKYKLQPHEHWMPLNELMERYPLKVPT